MLPLCRSPARSLSAPSWIGEKVAMTDDWKPSAIHLPLVSGALKSFRSVNVTTCQAELAEKLTLSCLQGWKVTKGLCPNCFTLSAWWASGRIATILGQEVPAVKTTIMYLLSKNCGSSWHDSQCSQKVLLSKKNCSFSGGPFTSRVYSKLTPAKKS